MAESDVDELRATARLPHLDIELVHRRPWSGDGETISVTLRAVPSFEAVGRMLETSNPWLLWSQMLQAAWSPWLALLAPPRGRAVSDRPANDA